MAISKTDLQIYIGLAGLAFTAWSFFKAKQVVDTVTDTTDKVGSKIGIGLYNGIDKVKEILGLPSEADLTKPTPKPMTSVQRRADELYEEFYGRYDSPAKDAIMSDADRLAARREQLRKLGLL